MGAEEEALRGVKSLLRLIDDAPDRDGLQATPDRVVRAMVEMTRGRFQDPAAILERTFEVAYSQMVVVSGIHFSSLCEHHLLPFSGSAVVGYIPQERVVGLSKIPRVVEAFARRLQVQERLTEQIAEALQEALRPAGVGVVLKSTHDCMACRGVAQRAQMVTSALRGAILDEPQTRAEFLAFCR